MRVLITGATGFVGRHLATHLESEGHRVDVVSRRPNVGSSWEPSQVERAVSGSEGVVHLAGAGVLDRRWSAAYREEILLSRVETTRRIAEACARTGRRLVSTSAVGYYGSADMGRVFGEQDTPGAGFLAEVCRRWEEALGPAMEAGASVSVVRVGVVLGRDGGALKRMLLPFRLGVGGPIAGGRQPFPWIHVKDLVRLYAWLLDDAERTGAFNGVAPGVCDQRTFARTLGRVLRRPAVVPTPGWALRAALGPGAELLTTGQNAPPLHAQEAGFVFEHGELEPALRELVDG